MYHNFKISITSADENNIATNQFACWCEFMLFVITSRRSFILYLKLLLNNWLLRNVLFLFSTYSSYANERFIKVVLLIFESGMHMKYFNFKTPILFLISWVIGSFDLECSLIGTLQCLLHAWYFMFLVVNCIVLFVNKYFVISEG